MVGSVWGVVVCPIHLTGERRIELRNRRDRWIREGSLAPRDCPALRSGRPARKDWWERNQPERGRRGAGHQWAVRPADAYWDLRQCVQQTAQHSAAFGAQHLGVGGRQRVALQLDIQIVLDGQRRWRRRATDRCSRSAATGGCAASLLISTGASGLLLIRLGCPTPCRRKAITGRQAGRH